MLREVFNEANFYVFFIFFLFFTSWTNVIRVCWCHRDVCSVCKVVWADGVKARIQDSDKQACRSEYTVYDPPVVEMCLRPTNRECKTETLRWRACARQNVELQHHFTMSDDLAASPNIIFLQPPGHLPRVAEKHRHTHTNKNFESSDILLIGYRLKTVCCYVTIGYSDSCIISKLSAKWGRIADQQSANTIMYSSPLCVGKLRIVIMCVIYTE